MDTFSIRKATFDDCDDMMSLINEMATFENMNHMVKLTAADLKEDGFGKDQLYKCFVAETSSNGGAKKTIVGYALYFYIYSTFEGKSSFLEDLYVTKEYRGKGIGTALWRNVAKEVADKGCKRMDFFVLTWNINAMKVYEKQGAINITDRDQFHLWRLEEDALKKFASTS